MKSEIFYLHEGRKDVTLTTYVLDDSPEMLNGAKRPAIVICPGGAYLSCSDREGEPVAMKFASMGYHAFVLRYSVYSEGSTEAFGGANIFGDMPVKPHCVHPAPVQDIGLAMLKIRDHAEEWLVDMNKIAVCGFSAGSHNAAMYAARWQDDIVAGSLGVDKELLRPAAAILCYTLSDYVYMLENTTTAGPFETAFFGASNTAFLGTKTPTEELLDEVSPARHVTENMPPTFLWATAADAMVPVQHSIRMAHALADHKIPFELHIFEEGAHGLSLATKATAQSKEHIMPDAAKWADLADAWLDKRFAFDLPEKIEYPE